MTTNLQGKSNILFNGKGQKSERKLAPLQVTKALSRAGLESSNLIVGIDFTKSNEWTATTHDQHLFSFYPEDRSRNGFEDVMGRYREIVPQLTLAGPISFVLAIEQAMTIAEKEGASITCY
ncbi:E3 ubiquitin-protein ligase RGLG2 [Artemisia annua]|uniref:E3 ubiquitin-protein ligase RGLG2 n=1 Tax=Artemisia annua TaxID=35608 RepID=A0A2U1QKP6_ARTAN|nr:E3 ubiquitin-protein ligase RGLG2 [Artemisia annua]